MLQRLSKHRSSTASNGSNQPKTEKKLLPWSRSSSNNAPNDKKRSASDASLRPDVMSQVKEYLEKFNFQKAQTNKICRKVKRLDDSVKIDINGAYTRASGNDDCAAIEPVLLASLPEKHFLRSVHHLYGSLLRRSTLFLSLIKAAEDAEVMKFETALVRSFAREHYTTNKFVILPPKGALYIVRRGLLRVSVNGEVVATLERGSVIDVCVLSDAYITIHELESSTGIDGTNRPSTLVRTNSSKFSVELANETKDNFEISSDSDLTDDVDEPLARTSELDISETASTKRKSSVGRRHRNSIVNVIFGAGRHRSESANNLSSSSLPRAHSTGRRASLSMQSPKKMQAYPLNSVSLSAHGTDVDNLFGYPYPFGCELGVIHTDRLRKVVVDMPTVSKNLENLSIALEYQLDAEEEEQRRVAEQQRMKLERERKLVLNAELGLACRTGSIQRARDAMASGAMWNESLDDKTGVTAVHVAASQGHAEVVKYLIESGASVKQLDFDGRTPLHLCCLLVEEWDQEKTKVMLKVLIGTSDVKEILMMKDRYGNTPLHLASNTGNIVMVKCLMQYVHSCENNSDILASRNLDGYTALEVCETQAAKRFIKPKSNRCGNQR